MSSTDSSTSSPRTLVPRWLAGRSELGVALLLGAAGLLVVLDAAGLQAPYSQSDPVGPRTMPYAIGTLLLVCAVALAVNVLRGGHGQAEEGEDIDLTAPTEWRVVLPLAGAFLANVLLIDSLGWVLSGALLFWGSARALGSRHLVRDVVVSLALSLLTFYGFYLGLGILLPAGLLEGVL
jgi:putative tricarboxylic transport membrane protein